MKMLYPVVRDNSLVQNITNIFLCKYKFTFGCPRSTLVENNKYVLYNCMIYHLDFYKDIGNTLCKILLTTV